MIREHKKRVWEDISTDIRFSDTQNNLSGYKLFVYDNDETAFYAVLIFSIKENSLSSVKKSILNEIKLKLEKRINVSFSGEPEEISVGIAVYLTHKGLVLCQDLAQNKMRSESYVVK